MLNKIILGVLIPTILCVLFGISVLAAEPNEPVYGDANGDCVVSIGDVVKVERIILGLDQNTPGADANIDGGLNMGDVVLIERMVLGLSPIYGDADGNQKIDEADVDKVHRMMLNLEKPTPGADANRDGELSIADATTIRLMLNRIK